MSKQGQKVKPVGGFFAAKSVVSKKGAAMKVTKLELTPRALEQLKANSQGIATGTSRREALEIA